MPTADDSMTMPTSLPAAADAPGAAGSGAGAGGDPVQVGLFGTRPVRSGLPPELDPEPAFDPIATGALILGPAGRGSFGLHADAGGYRFRSAAGEVHVVAAPTADPAGSGDLFGLAGMAGRKAGTALLPTAVPGVAPGAGAAQADELPTVVVQSLAFREGDAAAGVLSLRVSLSFPSPSGVTVQLDSVDHTARAGIDYQGVHRLVTIPPGQNAVTLQVGIIGNDRFEPTRVFELRLGEATGAQVGGPAFEMIVDDDAPPDLKLPSDPVFGLQWHLHAVGAPFAWSRATGQGVLVGVFDQGIDGSHPDLAANDGFALGVNAADLSAGGLPLRDDDNHGTFVAGVIGAARNGVGVVGVAHDATLVPIYSNFRIDDHLPTEIANAFGYARSLDVLNNSWGFGNLLALDPDLAFVDDARDPLYAPAFAALRELASHGRDGLGTVVVQASGDGEAFGDDTNLHNFQNSRFAVTVGATDFLGRIAPYSTVGASVLVAAPGGVGDGDFGDILTSDRVGAAGSTPYDIAAVGGTSMAAPIVSGIAALMLEARPGLGYRDVQQILALTARQTELGVGEWAFNGATRWNGGGMHYNAGTHAAGFGQVDAAAAVRLAASWDAAPLIAANLHELTASKTVDAAVPDGSPAGVRSVIGIDQDLEVERAEVTVDIRHPYVGDLSIVLTSPAGTASVLLDRPGQGVLSAFGSSQADLRFTFGTVLAWGETSRGDWSIAVYDRDAGDSGRFVDWSLTLVGRPPTSDDVFVYTDEYAALVAADPARGLLRDSDGGWNTVNAAASAADQRIDLSGRSPSLVGGASLSIDGAARVQRAIGGDGDDLLIAADHASTLRGMGGRDHLVGGPGIDLAVYDAERAAASLAKTAAGWQVGVGPSDVDQLAGIERVAFADVHVALDLDANAGRVARLLGAVFGAETVADRSFVGVGLQFADTGLSYEGLAQLAIDARLGPGAGHLAVVRLLYANVVGTLPPPADEAYFVGLLDSGGASVAGLGVLAAETTLNADRIGLVGLLQSGLEYMPVVDG